MVKFKSKISAGGSSLMGLGMSAALVGAMGGIMGKMFGLNDEKTPQKLAEEMMAGAVRGILEHFEYKLDDLKRQNERLQEKNNKLEEERDTLKEEMEQKKTKKK